MSKNKKTKKDYSYDLVAHLYSFFTGILFLFSGQMENRMRKHALKETLPLQGNEIILDLCSANGKGTMILSEMLSNGMVIGIDTNPAMVVIANNKTKNQKNLLFEVGDCSKIPFPDNYFHVVTASLALHELPTSILKKVFAEIRRVLQPQGYLYIFDFIYPDNATTFHKLVYYSIRTIEDASAARFMMVDQQALLQREGFQVKISNHYASNFIAARLYQLEDNLL